MTPEDAADAVARKVSAFGTKWMIDPETFAPGIEAGFAGIDFYVYGRGGVLGDVDPDVVVAAMGFLDPSSVRLNWDQGRKVMPPAEAARLFATACASWGRAHLRDDPEDPGLAELAELAARAAAAAPVSALPLFAGWRALEAPEDPQGAAAHHLNSLRELRGGAHLVALVAHGLSPLEAVLVKGGERNARFLGHQGPFPEVGDPQRAAWEEAERTTTAIVAPAFAALAPHERERLVALVSRLSF